MRYALTLSVKESASRSAVYASLLSVHALKSELRWMVKVMTHAVSLILDNQDDVRSGRAQTRPFPHHAHSSGKECPHQPQTAANDGNRYPPIKLNFKYLKVNG